MKTLKERIKEAELEVEESDGRRRSKKRGGEMTLYELIEMVDELDKCGIFEIHNMNDRGLFYLYDSYSFNGDGFSPSDDYYYFRDGDMISIRESELYDFYESALNVLTDGEYEREKHSNRLEILQGGRK